MSLEADCAKEVPQVQEGGREEEEEEERGRGRAKKQRRRD